ncbi:translation initiation factor IF-2 [Ignicoccus islandicus DSM 13165]|uniref:Probable translation initiation factor IF-2 n=1 Tax=Ignicoccus islandicus DSM 13165 TaxID=940295 RepID=A0A0U3F8V7_9CREN|nr:translation initiation factor IF-2 [Ignicoccus islandicus]ALU12073.1 translation initiation factor IF-2 [Ignicoccus islandicus DSM 13165]
MSEKRLRQPIVAVLGHVDHGKTTLLDRIRGTTVAMKEPGKITQHVGASLVPTEVIEKVTEPLKKLIPTVKLELPGLLFIDTPGHSIFSNLRKRGGAVADLAILVVDVMEGFQPQTIEAVEILKQRKVPFIVAANKIDKIPGWKSIENVPFLVSVRHQDKSVVEYLDNRIYEIMGSLAELGFDSDRFDRVKDYTRQLAIVPVSAKTGEGIPELLALLAGLAQRYMKGRLKYVEGPAKGVVMEVKEEPGYGTTLDTIIYDGIIRQGDVIVVGSLEGPIVTKVRALLLPEPLQEIRATKKFRVVDEVSAAAGVKIVAPNLENAVAGAPVFVVSDESQLEKVKEEVMKEIEDVLIETDKEGVVVKADTLGTLEALVQFLKSKDIPVRMAKVGPVTKRDVMEAMVSKRMNKEYGVILAFNVKVLPEAKELAEKEDIKIFVHDVIYKLIEDFENWVKELREQEKRKELEQLVRPGKLRILPGFVFRRSDPVIVGIEVLGGTLMPGYPLMKESGEKVGKILQIQDKGKSVKEVKAGQQVAISIKGRVMVGRHLFEGDVLYTDVPSSHAKLWLTKYKNELSEDERYVLNEIIKIKRKTDPLYGLAVGT